MRSFLLWAIEESRLPPRVDFDFEDTITKSLSTPLAKATLSSPIKNTLAGAFSCGR